MLTMRTAGPTFEHTHEFVSKNYIVQSDIDKKICLDASRVLEASLNMFRSELGNVAKDKTEKGKAEKFRVFIFRGQQGYDRYTKRILGERVAHTAGLYSPSSSSC